MAAQSERTQGTYYSIADDRLAAIVATGLTEEQVIDIALDYDWTEDTMHQIWLDTEPVAKVAKWVACVLADEEADLDD